MKSPRARQSIAVAGALLAAGFASTSPAQDSLLMKPFGIVIHGGAGAIKKIEMTPALEQQCRAVLAQAADAGHAVLAKGGTSLDAVTAAVVILEDSPLFNAGKGAVLTSSGSAELDASIMDGKTRAAGGVTGIRHIKNPVELARAVMEKSSHVLFHGDGAERFAKEQGFKTVLNSYFIIEGRKQELKKAQDAAKKSGKRAAASTDGDVLGVTSYGTVGAVALDLHGNLAAATSTGGRTNKKPGRVGDSPIIGAGTFADNATCAVSGTGHGEYFMRTVAAYDVAALMQYKDLTVDAATKEVLRKIADLGGSGGLIAIDREGRVAMPFNTAGMYRAWRTNRDAKTGVAIYVE